MRLLNKILIATVSAAVLFTACKKEYLERAPLTAVSEAEFWKTTNDLQLYCNNFYNSQPSYTGFGNMGIYSLDADQGSDNMIQQGHNAAMNGERIVPTTGGGWDWTQLRNINYFLGNYKKVNASWDNVKPYVGEALYFRAQFYFGMLRTFGNVPWMNTAVTDYDDPKLFEARLPRNLVADSIISDLDKAISYLPTKGSAKTSRINKEVAMAFLSRVALFEGTWEKYHAGTPFGASGSDGKKYLQKAADVAGALINSNVHSLDNVGAGEFAYWNLFNKPDYSASKEIMLWRRFEVGVIQHNWHRYTRGGAARGITKELVEDYLCKDGLPTSVSPLYKGDNTTLNLVTDRDPRLTQTIYVPDGKHIITSNQPGGIANILFTVPVMTGGGEAANITGYQMYKGHQPDYMQQFAGEVGITALIFFRYAEVLLNYAEAKAELGTITQSDLDISINKLRDRVGMAKLMMGAITPDPKWIFPALSPIINEVRRERRVELAIEGFRRDDIYRWAAADELIIGWKPKGAKRDQFNGLVPAADLAKYPVDANGYIEFYKNVAALATGYKFKQDRDYLAPLPSDQLIINPKIAPQNPGW